MHRGRVLVFIVAYNAERTLHSVLDRIPYEELGPETEILVIDDSSQDNTFEIGVQYKRANHGIPLTVLRTPINQGYGGNQKLGYRYAIEKGFDVVALIHGDGQYPPELLPQLVEPLLTDQADAMFGSRMVEPGAARKGGMPLYKYVGNRILTTVQNRLLGTRFSEFHSGYRAYSVRALSQVPFEHNTNDFHFDTEIIIQLLRGGWRIGEIPIPTYYGDEICYVNGLGYAWNVLKSTLLSRFHDLGVLYHRRFDLAPGRTIYHGKGGYPSSHTMAIAAVPTGSKVLDIGCGTGYFVASELRRQKQCFVVGLDHDHVPAAESAASIDKFIAHNLDSGDLPRDVSGDYDVVLMLDVIEHVRSPEELLDAVRGKFGLRQPRILITTPNIAFLPLRLSLLLGAFRYGRYGILDMTHRRLFTFGSLRAVLEQGGFQVRHTMGIPAPFPKALGDTTLARLLLRLNQAAIRVSKSLFSYQVYIEAVPAPTVDTLLAQTLASEETSTRRVSMNA